MIELHKKPTFVGQIYFLTNEYKYYLHCVALQSDPRIDRGQQTHMEHGERVLLRVYRYVLNVGGDVGIGMNLSWLSIIQGAPSRPGTGAQSLDQLLERQWEQGSQFLMEQAQHFDSEYQSMYVASSLFRLAVISCLYS